MSALEQRLINELREIRTRVHDLERDIDDACFDISEVNQDADYFRKLCEENDIEYD
jgi:hypothetical protein